MHYLLKHYSKYSRTKNRTRKPLAIALSRVERRLRVRDNGNNVNNVQYKSNRN
jgi:hypothetical protein